MARRSFSNLSLKEAMEMVPSQRITQWDIHAPEQPPSGVLLAMLQRYNSFDQISSEAAKVLLIDVILAEIVPNYLRLKVWKEKPLETETVAGTADYLIAPDYAYLETPLLCAIEAKRDDFEAGERQCIAEMAVCRDKNVRDGHDIEMHGVVSNGQGWVFYRLTRTPQVLVSGLFTLNDLPKLLGMLNHVCAACAANVP